MSHPANNIIREGFNDAYWDTACERVLDRYHGLGTVPPDDIESEIYNELDKMFESWSMADL